MLSFIISWKFRKGRRKNGMVSFISIISTISIALGIAALIIGLSAMNGFERELNQRLLSLIPNGKIFAYNNQPLTNWKNLQAQLQNYSDVTTTAPFIELSALIEKNGKIKPIQLQGIEPTLEANFSHLTDYIEPEQWNHFIQNEEQTLIGDGLAKSLGINPGDKITLILPDSDAENAFKKPKRIRLTVSGIVQFNGELGNYLTYLPLNTLQRYLNLGDQVTAVKFNVKNSYQVEQLVQRLSLLSDQTILVSSWMSQDNNKFYRIYQDIQLVRSIMYIAMFVVIAVACFSIISSLVIAVKDKQSEIAILKTLGASNRLIRTIFIWYGLLSGLIGSLIGIIVGCLIASNLTLIFEGIEKLTGRTLLNGDVYFINFIPSEIHFFDVLSVFLITIVLALMASLYPAYRACKIDPVKILSN